MKKLTRHLIGLLAIIALSFLGEILIFNHDTLSSKYDSIYFNSANGSDIQAEIEEVLTPLTKDEENEIKVHLDTERILAEYRGEEFVPTYDDNIVVNDDESLSRYIKQMHIKLNLGDEYYIKKLKLEVPVDKQSGFSVTAYKDGQVVGDKMYCSIEPKIDAGIMNAFVTADCLEILLSTEEELSIDDLQISIFAKTQINPIRLAFLMVCLLTVYLLLFAGKDVFAQMKNRPEWFFAIFALMLGGLLIRGFGTNMVGYDEYVHARASYKLSFGTTIETTEAAMQMVANQLPYFNNPEERVLIEAYEETVHDPQYIAPDIGHQTRIPRTETRVYYPMAAGFFIGRILHMRFADMMQLACLGNLLCYIAIVFFAVKKAKGYQMVVAAIGILPNNLFMASTISYDMLVNAGLLLGYVLLLNELLTPDEKIKPGNAFVMLFAFLVGCLSKPVYIVMCLMLLFAPSKKFNNKISEVVFKVALIGLSGLMLYNIFFPTPVAGGDYALVSNVQYAGDKRNIGTSTVGQLKFVLENPWEYTKILLNAMYTMLYNFTIGRYAYVSYSYMGTAPFFVNWLMILLGIFASLFADVKESVGKFRGGLTHLMNFGVAAIVFSSMYISFTPVASPTILGVQGRYMIPLFLPFLSCFMGWGMHRLAKTGKKDIVTVAREKIQAMPAVYERVIWAIMVSLNLCMTCKMIIIALTI